MTKKITSPYQKNALIRWVKDENDWVLVSDKTDVSETLLESELLCYNVKSSFSLNGGTTKELVDHQVISTAEKSLILVILLEGKLDFGYDDRRFMLDASVHPVGVLVNLARPVIFRRILCKGNRLTKLNVILPTEWVTERATANFNLNAFINEHKASLYLDLKDDMLSLVADILCQKKSADLLEKINLEILVQRLIVQVLKQVIATESASMEVLEKASNGREGVSASKSKNSTDDLIRYIEDNLDRELSAKSLSEYMAMSESNLQRRFKQSLGCNVQSYIRRRRLEIARQQLEKGIFSIAEVAYSAGYKYPSNFTNAFKKTFGYPPAEVPLYR
ncbi:helix-turn-helix domain-containing protein [Marinomonas algarum]|uniref:AraC family transcriptional regulator n=1 Tax=Marinomonas algarum TaxID=2883105 RepID=A0A9X1IJM7_9GAMM|nr:AraC family transcriptional regulator [Marinomonas algarum]MCB5160485.1 AraC family transcriptional regulator [Marinomonas algarum]